MKGRDLLKDLSTEALTKENGKQVHLDQDSTYQLILLIHRQIYFQNIVLDNTQNGYSYMFKPQYMAIFREYMLNNGHVQSKHYIVIGKW